MTGASPVVDITNVRSQNVLTREVLDALPTSQERAGARGGDARRTHHRSRSAAAKRAGARASRCSGSRRSMARSNGIRTLDGMKLSSAYNVSLASRESVQPDDGAGDRAWRPAPRRRKRESSGLNIQHGAQGRRQPVPRQLHRSRGPTTTFSASNLTDELRARGLTAASYGPARSTTSASGSAGPSARTSSGSTARSGRGAASRSWRASTSTRTRRHCPRQSIRGEPADLRADTSRPAIYDRYTQGRRAAADLAGHAEAEDRVQRQRAGLLLVLQLLHHQPRGGLGLPRLSEQQLDGHLELPGDQQAAVPGRRVAAAGSAVQRHARRRLATRIPVFDLSSSVAVRVAFRRRRRSSATPSMATWAISTHTRRASSMSYITGSHSVQGRHADDDRAESRSATSRRFTTVQYIIRQACAGASSSRARIPHRQQGTLKLMLGALRAGSVDDREPHAESRRAASTAERLQPGADAGPAAEFLGPSQLRRRCTTCRTGRTSARGSAPPTICSATARRRSRSRSAGT